MVDSLDLPVHFIDSLHSNPVSHSVDLSLEVTILFFEFSDF